MLTCLNIDKLFQAVFVKMSFGLSKMCHIMSISRTVLSNCGADLSKDYVIIWNSNVLLLTCQSTALFYQTVMLCFKMRCLHT
jgi:hypothetical protein